MARSPLQEAKRVAGEGLSFRIAEAARVFPPRDVANAFFTCGHDDHRADADVTLCWRPFELSDDEYEAFLQWWREEHPDARIDRFGIRGPEFSKWFSAAGCREP
jgi:hypothetical protein